MSIRRTLTRLGAPLGAAAVITVMAVGPASAHVTVSPSTATAGDFTVMTVSVPHGCDGSATTKIEVEIPEPILSVTPTRNPFWTQKSSIVKLDSPITDDEGNKVTERTGTVVYTAKEPLPDHVRDSLELSFQIPPETAGDTLRFPTIQTCEKGQTAWTEVPADGQDPFELEHPAPFFDVQPTQQSGTEATALTDDSVQQASAETPEEGSDMLSWLALGVGALGLVVGGAALARGRKSA